MNPPCELCGNDALRGKAVCARCDEGLRRCEAAPKRGPSLTRPTRPPEFMKTLPERRRLREPVVVVRAIPGPPTTCVGCGQRNVFDVRLHVCREDRRTA